VDKQDAAYRDKDSPPTDLRTDIDAIEAILLADL